MPEGNLGVDVGAVTQVVWHQTKYLHLHLALVSDFRKADLQSFPIGCSTDAMCGSLPQMDMNSIT